MRGDPGGRREHGRVDVRQSLEQAVFGIVEGDPMSNMDVTDTTRCENCGDEFANHYYVPSSITQYRCPRPHVESCYGFFTGGDPRAFSPDHESCSPEEIENHRKACDLADALERDGKPVNWECPSGWEQWGDAVVHVLRAPFGIGVTAIEVEQLFEAADAWCEGDDDEGE